MADPEKSVRKLISALNKLPANMRGFSRSMRTLYAEKAMSPVSSTCLRFNELRDQTRLDAMIYLKGVLPFAVNVIRSISEFFDYYEALSFENWKENLAGITTEVRGNKQCCDVVVQLHDSIKISLKSREQEVNNILEEYEKQFRMQKSQQTAASGSHEKLGMASRWMWTFGRYCALFFANYFALSTVAPSNSRTVLFLGANGFVLIEWLIASKLFSFENFGKRSLEVDGLNAHQLSVNTDAVRVVTDTTVPALAKFMDGLQEAASFFSHLEKDLEYLQSNEKAKIRNAMKVHYDITKKNGPEVKRNCCNFFSILPDVETDFLSIADDSKDKYCVDKWLEEQKNTFSRKYQISTPQLRRMISNFSSEAASKLMVGEY